MLLIYQTGFSRGDPAQSGGLPIEISENVDARPGLSSLTCEKLDGQLATLIPPASRNMVWTSTIVPKPFEMTCIQQR